MIYLTTGKPGSFKTHYTIKRVLDYVNAQEKLLGYRREVYCYNITDINVPDWIVLDDPKSWYDLPDNSIVVVDECQKLAMGFGAESHLKTPPRHISDLETHRHRGFDFFFITQSPSLINSRIKPLVEEHFHFVRKNGMNYATVYRYEGIINNPETRSNLNGLETFKYVRDKKIDSLYTSASAHTHKKRIPKAVLYGVPFLILTCFLIYKAVFTVNSLNSDKFQSNVEQNNQAFQSNYSSKDDSSYKKEKFNPIVDFTPRIAYLPETAPAYDELRKPKDFPRPNCVLLEKTQDCKCFTQQATIMKDYPAELCLHYVKNGFFDPTKERSNTNASDKSQ